MNMLKKVMVLGVSVVIAAGMAACDKPGPAETAGKNIDEATEKLGQQGSKVGEVVGDAAITAKIKTALLAEPNLKSLQISVDTMQGRVTLSGTADSQTNIDRAKEIASAVSGVASVDSELALTSAQK